ncbi:hypothetical protein BJ742DRAFT_837059 [Cladochytrium replicatum]|nr:hypothetical protein BJ742DRAFT_837059 [Cladochytrium replicatum]
MLAFFSSSLRLKEPQIISNHIETLNFPPPATTTAATNPPRSPTRPSTPRRSNSIPHAQSHERIPLTEFPSPSSTIIMPVKVKTTPKRPTTSESLPSSDPDSPLTLTATKPCTCRFDPSSLPANADPQWSLISDSHFSVPFRSLALFLFTPDPPSEPAAPTTRTFRRRFLEDSQGAKNYVLTSEWSNPTSKPPSSTPLPGTSRTMKYTVPVLAAGVLTNVTDCIVAVTPSSLCIESRSVTPDAPFGDEFVTVARICLTGAGSSTTRVRVYARVEFTKGAKASWIARATIPSAVRGKVVDYYAALGSYLKAVEGGNTFGDHVDESWWKDDDVDVADDDPTKNTDQVGLKKVRRRSTRWKEEIEASDPATHTVSSGAVAPPPKRRRKESRMNVVAGTDVGARAGAVAAEGFLDLYSRDAVAVMTVLAVILALVCLAMLGVMIWTVGEIKEVMRHMEESRVLHEGR